MAGIQEIVSGIMISNPAHYAGRDNMLVDLDSDKLERITENIYREGGSKAVSAFVEMVRDLTEKNDVSATTFLVALDDLIRNQWEYSGNVRSTRMAIADAIETSDYPVDVKENLRVVAYSPPSSSAVDASKITGDFLRARTPRTALRAADVEVAGSFTARLRASLEDKERNGGGLPR